MCLGSIGQVVDVGDGRARVRIGAAEHEVLAMTLPDGALAPGDWVVTHSGFALERLTAAEAIEALRIRATEDSQEVDS